MAHDLLPIENDVYRYEASEGQTKEVIFITDLYKNFIKGPKFNFLIFFLGFVGRKR